MKTPTPPEHASTRPAKAGPVHPNAAGIDLGSRSHYVALPQDRGQQVREFACYTQDLHAMAAWLKKHGITTVAMEATGIYWVPVYQVLETSGLDVQLVNARHYANVPGRKSDVIDCQWLQQLHQNGLVRGSFRPADGICRVRSYTRQRANFVEESSRHVQRMQKALDQMNLHPHKVVANLTGKTGMSIVAAIVSGERDPAKLAAFRDRRCKQPLETIERALTGDWREEHLFCLRQEYEMYNQIQAKIAECEAESLAAWATMEARSDDPPDPPDVSKRVTLETREIARVAGVDPTSIEGIGDGLARSIVAEVGVDMGAWRTAKHFVAWAGLAPPTKITGGKRYRTGRAGPRGPVAQLFKMAASATANSKTALGAFYRRLRARRGSGIANDATARKIAEAFYRLMRHGRAYLAGSSSAYEARYRSRLIRGALRTLERLGHPLPGTPVLARQAGS